MRFRGEIAAHKPGAGGVIDMIHVPAGAKDVPGIKGAVPVQIQMIFRDKLPQIL